MTREFDFDINYRSLSNDVRHLEILIPNAKTSACVALVKTGSQNETPGKAGLHHLLEHVAFRGTERFPNYETWTKVASRIEADHDADAEKQYTEFWVFGSSEHTAKNIFLVSQLLKPTFPSSAVKKEKAYIVGSELAEYSDDAEELVEDFFEGFLFEGTALSGNGLGNEKSIKAITRRDLRKVVEKYYRGANVLVVTAGSFSRKIRSLVEECFGSLPEGPSLPYEGASGYGKPGRKVYSTQKTDRAHFMLGFAGVHRAHELYYPLRVLGAMLGGSEYTGSSRLYQAVQLKKGQAYSLSTKIKARDDTGYIAAKGAVDPKVLIPILDTVRRQVYGIVENATKEEVKLAKAFLRGKLKRDFESTLKVAEEVGIPVLISNKIETPREMLKNINAVKLDDIRRVAEELLRPELERLVVVGPVNEKLRKIRKFNPR